LLKDLTSSETAHLRLLGNQRPVWHQRMELCLAGTGN
jgi:hypothetical protein